MNFILKFAMVLLELSKEIHQKIEEGKRYIAEVDVVVAYVLLRSILMAFEN